MKVSQVKKQSLGSIPPKILVLTIASIFASISNADVDKRMIGDLEIYKAPEQGSSNIMMMLDTSGSMGDFGVRRCYYARTVSDSVVVKKDDGTDGATISYRLNKCDDNSKYDRMGRLKKALIPVFANPKEKLGPKYKSYRIGFGTFFMRPRVSRRIPPQGGKIIVEASELTYENRLNLVRRLVAMQSSGSTPSAHAYAEAGAYMLGTNTNRISTTKTYSVAGWVTERSNRRGIYYEYRVCRRNQPNTQKVGKFDVNLCNSSVVISRKGFYKSSILNRFGNKFSGPFDFSVMGNISQSYKEGTKKFFFRRNTGNGPGTTGGISGFDLSVDSSKTKDLTKYASPIKGKSQCSGDGIFFLTDGEPNSSYNRNATLNLMNLSLQESSNININRCQPIRFKLPYGSGQGDFTDMNTLYRQSASVGGAWECMAAYSRVLSQGNHNKKVPIKTATVGFGRVFSSLKTSTVPVLDDKGKPVLGDNGKPLTKSVDLCETASSQDAKNLCYLGEEGYGFGEGGFTATDSSEGVRDSLISFLEKLGEDIHAVPSGTINVPEDPYNASKQQPIAYYPSIKAEVASNDIIWSGNMKKYSLNEGSLFGKKSRKLFLNIAGTLDKATEDFWSKGSFDNNDAVTSGGFYSNLKSPNSAVNDVRTLFVEDWTNKTDKTPVVKKFSVNGSGKLTLDDKLLSTNFFIDTDTYTEERIKALVGFLGFTVDPTNKKKIKNVTLKKENASIKVLGATVHSTPALVSYSAKLDDVGRVTDKRDEYVLFGSMDGALHLVDSDDFGSNDGGTETFAFVPKEILVNQHEGLVKGGSHDKIGAPKMGIDAPWLVTAKYKYGTSTVSGKNIFAYGGMRLGGTSFYGMDLTDKDQPKLKFVITPNSSGFERLGHTWSRPTKAKIKTSANKGTKGTDVLVFGGGYDTCYENEEFQVSSATDSMKDHKGQSCKKTMAKGNAVYIVNANDGKLIWSASTSENKAMVNSIVGSITVLDRNDDGFMDHLYFADLGGQVFRADFKNAGFVNKDKSIESGFSNERLVRVLKDDNEGKYIRRFYEKPIVSFYRNPKNKNRLFAMVNVISGDRSSPVSKMRKKISESDRVYGLWDIDVTKTNNQFFDDGFKPAVKDISIDNLYNLYKDTGIKPSDKEAIIKNKKTAIVMGLKTGKKKGWYYPLTRFDGYNNVRYSKGVGKSAVINSFLFTTVYNPDMDYSDGKTCSASVIGGSERQLYCLPYGVCMDKSSKTGTGGFIPAGQGIQELTLGPRGKNKLDQTLLIGTRTIADQLKDRIKYNKDKAKDSSKIKDQIVGGGGDKKVGQIGGDGSAPVLLFNERYTFTPNKWYESNE